MRKELNAGKTVAQVAKSIRDFQTLTHAFRDNELHTFDRAWKSMSDHLTQVTVVVANGQKYPKWIPLPYATRCHLFSVHLPPNDRKLATNRGLATSEVAADGCK